MPANHKLEPLGEWRTNDRGKQVFVPFHMSAGEEIYIRTENAKADTLTLCIDTLERAGFHEAAAELGKLWDQPPPKEKTT